LRFIKSGLANFESLQVGRAEGSDRTIFRKHKRKGRLFCPGFLAFGFFVFCLERPYELFIPQIKDPSCVADIATAASLSKFTTAEPYMQ